jgi:hypothetical protein
MTMPRDGAIVFTSRRDLAMLTKIRDWHQTLSWKLGFGRAKAGRPHSCPWWADKTVYSLAYMQGQGVELQDRRTPDQTNANAHQH